MESFISGFAVTVLLVGGNFESKGAAAVSRACCNDGGNK
jgi:hypothetical protein